MDENAVDYRPPPTGRALMLSSAVVRGIVGPLGSGKSVVCTMELLRQACEVPPDPKGRRMSRFAVIRNTARMLRDTTIKTVHEWVPPDIAGRFYSSTNTFMVAFPLSDGTEVRSEWLFRPLESSDDVRNLLSLEVTGAWINEYREINPDIFINLLGRIGRYPSAKAVGSAAKAQCWSGIIMDSNPPSVGSFWYDLFEDNESEARKALQDFEARFDRPLLELFRQPSGLSPTAENRENLPKGYYELLQATAPDKEWVRVHVEGEYGTRRDGLPVYPEFSSVHASPEPIMPVPRRPITVGCDFGLTPAAVFVQQDAEGRWLILDEITLQNAGAEHLADAIRRKMAERFSEHEIDVVWADPAGQQRGQANLTTCFAVMKTHGLPVRASEQALETRLSAVRRPLSRMVAGGPGLLIDPRCKVVLSGFRGNYRYAVRREDGKDEIRSETPDKTFESHVHDALQYVLAPYEGRAASGKTNRTWGRTSAFNRPVKASTAWSPWG